MLRFLGPTPIIYSYNSWTSYGGYFYALKSHWGGLFQPPWGAHGVAASDPYIYIADLSAGLQIYKNLLIVGRVMSFSEKHFFSGHYQLKFPVADLPSGIYFLRAESEFRAQPIKVLIVR